MGDQDVPGKGPESADEIPPGKWEDKAYPHLGAYLRQLRESLGLSQEELAQRSLWTKHPFDRTYVAHIENGRTSELAGRYLNYLALLFADMPTVMEILAAGDRLTHREISEPYPDLVKHCRRAVEDGIYGRALSLALRTLDRAQAEGEKEWIPKFQLIASTVFRYMQCWILAKRFAEAALNSRESDVTTRFRAAMQLVSVCLALDELRSAESFLLFANGEETGLAIDRGTWHQEKALVEIHKQNYAVVETEARSALACAEEAGSIADQSRALCLVARALQARGKGPAAREAANEAVRRAQEAKDAAVILRARLAQALTLCRALKVKEAKAVLYDLEDEAKRLNRKTDLLEARVLLLELGVVTGDRGLLKFMGPHVRTALLDVRLEADLRRQAEQALESWRKQS